MKKYRPLVITKTSTWSKKTWRYYTPIWFNQFIESLTNTIKWLPAEIKKFVDKINSFVKE